jgi:hypothetical protein
MTRNRLRSDGSAVGPHTLVEAEPVVTRPLTRLLLILSATLILGMSGALIWLAQSSRGKLETLPEILAQATQTATPAATLAAESAASLPATTPDALAANAGEPGDVANVGLLPPANAPVLPPMPVLRAELARVTVIPPTPTPTVTPRPALSSLDAVVGVGGADLWSGESGILVARLAQGALVTATARSDDGGWVQVTAPGGETGWVAGDQLIASDLDRLTTQAVVIIPITPTPARPGAVAPATTTTAAAPPAQTGAPATGKGGVAPPTTAALPAGPTARVTLQDARLNLRAGPGSGYAVIAKSEPNALLGALARDATGQWIQVTLPTGRGFGWAAADYLALDVATTTLPVSAAVSDAPAYGAAGIGSLPVPTAAAPRATAQGIPGAGGLQGKLVIQTSWGGDIYLYDLVSGDLRLLTGGFDPALSPDGQQVAFTRTGGEQGLYLINVDGSNERLIFSGRELLRSPKFSPDGQYIVFERGDEVLRCTLTDAGRCYPPLNPDTERQQKLARVDINGQNYQDIPVLERARTPDWNRAGIVYGSPAGLQITQDQPGATSQLLFFNIRKQYELDPDWQPNGGRVIFQRRENDHWEIYSVAPDGSGLQALTFPSFTLVEQLPSNVAPAWSPDGQHIVYLSNNTPSQSAGEWRIWVMDANGQNQRPLPIDLDFVYTFVGEQMVDWSR